MTDGESTTGEIPTGSEVRWNAPALASHVAQTTDGFVISLVGGSTELHLTQPISLLRSVRFDNGQQLLAISATWRSEADQLMVFGGDAEVLSVLDRLPGTSGDPRGISDRVQQAIVEFGLQQQTAPLPEPEPVNGALSTDGTFITLTTDAQRTHFVVAMDELPQLNSPLEILPDGSLQIELVLPGGEHLLLNVSADAAIDAEKAATLLTSIHRARLPIADAGTPATADIAPTSPRILGYEMTGWSKQDLGSVLQRLRDQRIDCRVMGRVLTVPFGDQTAADSAISLTRVFSSPFASRAPAKFLDGRPLRIRPASNEAQTSQTPPPASRVVAPAPSSPEATIARTAAPSNSKKWLLAGVATIVAAAIAIGVAAAGGDNSTQTPSNQADEAPSTPCSQLSQIVSELKSGALNPEQAYNDAYAAADVLDSVRWGVIAGSIRGQANSGFPLQSVSMIQGYITQRC